MHFDVLACYGVFTMDAIEEVFQLGSGHDCVKALWFS
jgi:hypothetical protein